MSQRRLLRKAERRAGRLRRVRQELRQTIQEGRGPRSSESLEETSRCGDALRCVGASAVSAPGFALLWFGDCRNASFGRGKRSQAAGRLLRKAKHRGLQEPSLTAGGEWTTFGRTPRRSVGLMLRVDSSELTVNVPEPRSDFRSVVSLLRKR